MKDESQPNSDTSSTRSDRRILSIIRDVNEVAILLEHVKVEVRGRHSNATVDWCLHIRNRDADALERGLQWTVKTTLEL